MACCAQLPAAAKCPHRLPGNLPARQQPANPTVLLRLPARHPPSPAWLCRLVGYWADCEAGVGSDLKAARAVWEGALKGAAGRYADTWAAYIAFERQRGNIREARTLYKRAYRWANG